MCPKSFSWEKKKRNCFFERKSRAALKTDHLTYYECRLACWIILALYTLQSLDKLINVFVKELQKGWMIKRCVDYETD